MGAASLLSDADLHGLVDGQVDPQRRADLLRRAASSPRDRALIEAWQDQNDLIRAAFADVEREPLPRALDLRRPPQLRPVPLGGDEPLRNASLPRWRRVAVRSVVVTAMVAALFGAWYVAGISSEGLGTLSIRLPDVERMLADRTMAALAFGETDAAVAVTQAEPPPTTAIPDLSDHGFTFTAAEARGVTPKSVVFRYRNTNNDRIAIGATRTLENDSDPTPHDNGFIWHRRHVAYAIFGTVALDRLRLLANSLTANLPD